MRWKTFCCAAAACALIACDQKQAAPGTAANAAANSPTPAAPAQPIVAAPPHHDSSDARNARALRSSMTGVFTAEQAKAGEDVYAGTCRGCHMGSSHTATFKTNWTGYPLSELADYIAQNMPKNAPGSLSPDDATVVLAYLLKLTGMPAGPTPLSGDPSELAKIRFDTLSVGRK